MALVIPLLLANATNVRDVPKLLRHLPSGGIVVAFVQTEMLGLFRRWGWPVDHDGIEGRFEQQMIVPIGSGNTDRQGTTGRIDEHAVFHAILATVRGVGSDMIPPKRAFRIAASTDCQSHSTPPSASHSSTSTAQMAGKTPRSTHR